MSRVAVVLVAALFVGSAFGGALTYDNYYSYIYGPGGVKIPAGADWVFALYHDVGGDGPDDFLSNDDDVLIGTAVPWNPTYAGVFAASFDPVPGLSDVFGRVYNSSDFVNDANPGSADQYVDVGGYLGLAVFTTPSDVPSPFVVGVQLDTLLGGDGSGPLSDPPGTDPTGGDWEPVPEPGTLALFGVGMLTLAARRFRKR
jgi:hypothetical protein